MRWPSGDRACMRLHPVAEPFRRGLDAGQHLARGQFHRSQLESGPSIRFHAHEQPCGVVRDGPPPRLAWQRSSVSASGAACLRPRRNQRTAVSETERNSRPPGRKRTGAGPPSPARSRCAAAETVHLPEEHLADATGQGTLARSVVRRQQWIAASQFFARLQVPEAEGAVTS